MDFFTKMNSTMMMITARSQDENFVSVSVWFEGKMFSPVSVICFSRSLKWIKFKHGPVGLDISVLDQTFKPK